MMEHTKLWPLQWAATELEHEKERDILAGPTCSKGNILLLFKYQSISITYIIERDMRGIIRKRGRKFQDRNYQHQTTPKSIAVKHHSQTPFCLVGANGLNPVKYTTGYKAKPTRGRKKHKISPAGTDLQRIGRTIPKRVR